MSVLMKDPDAALDYSVDWSSYLEPDESLTSSSWLVEPAGELTAGAGTFSTTVATTTLSGGERRHVYRITNRIATSNGRIDDRSFTIRVEQQ